MKIKKGDNVLIIKGKDRGKTGKVIEVLPKENKVVVEGLNLYKKHQRPKKEGEKGEIVMVPRPMSVSNVMIICKSCNRPTRVGYLISAHTKERICKRCGSKI
jgi:large subunit ribosomal protein L24